MADALGHNFWLALAVAGAIWLFLQFRLRYERQNRNRLEQLVNVRTTELQTQNQALAEFVSGYDLAADAGKTNYRLAESARKLSIYVSKVSTKSWMCMCWLSVCIMPNGRCCRFSHWLENGRKMASFELSLQPEQQLAAVCFNQQREINIRNREEFFALPGP